MNIMYVPTCDDTEHVDDADSPPFVNHLQRKSNDKLEDQVENKMSITEKCK